MATSQDRLAAAAAELVKAAEMDTNSASFDRISADLAGLKDTIDSKLNTVNQAIGHSKTNFDEKLNTVNHHLSTLKDEVAANTAEIQKQNKLRALEWAIANAEIGSFAYYEGNYRKESKTLVKNALLSFRRGFGYYIGEGTLTENRHYGIQESNEEKNKKKKEYRDKLVTQIHQLTGQKPRLELDVDRCAIYYS